MFNNEFGAKVDRMKSVYRGNPEKLKQSSGINADLSKLMAYQSMISERQALENEAVLRREQQPSSLVEQYEDKLVQGNVDNMKSRAARVGGIPQNLQQPPTAQGAPQGAPQGIASQPRPNMQGMAQGGIVGYQAGGELSRRERALKALGITEDALERMSPDQKKVVEQQIQGETAEEKAQDAAATAAAPTTGAPTTGAPTTAATAAAPTPATDPTTGGVATLPVGTGTVLRADPKVVADPEVVADPKTPAEKAAERAAALAEAKKTYKGKSPTQAALDEFGIPSVLTDVKRSTETPIADALGADAMTSKQAQAGADVGAQTATERARLTKEREALGIDAEYQRQIDAQKALDAKATDPAAMRKADRDAILRGMALGGVRGSTLAQNRLAANRSKGEQTRLDRMSKINTDRNTAKFEMLKDIDSKAAEAYSMYAKVQTDAFNSLVGMTEAELGNMEENFKNNVLYQQGEIQNVLTAADLTVANTMKEIAQGSLDLSRTVQAQISASNALGTINKEMRSSQDLERQRAQVNLTDSDPAIKAAAEEKLAQLDNDILVAQAPMLQLVKTLTERMVKLK